MFSLSIFPSKAALLSIFPVCAENGSSQSERINNFHKFFATVCKEFNNTKFSYKLIDDKTDICETVKKRNYALVQNSDHYLNAKYRISGDSVSISYSISFTKFVDKELDKQNVSGLLPELDKIYKVLVQKIFNSYSQGITPDQWIVFFNLIKKDKELYADGGSDNIDNFELGSLAYKENDYKLAEEKLLKVKPASPNYAQTCYMLGHIYISADNFSKSLDYFSKAKAAGIAENDIDAYIKCSKVLIKPAQWYNTSIKRRNWWSGLSAEQSQQILQLMNNLKINNKTFKSGYAFDDADIELLFKSRTLVFKDMKIDNFKNFASFSNADVIVLDNCKYNSPEGIDKFINLKFIRARDNSLLKSVIADFLIKEKVKLIVTN